MKILFDTSEIILAIINKIRNRIIFYTKKRVPGLLEKVGIESITCALFFYLIQFCPYYTSQLNLSQRKILIGVEKDKLSTQNHYYCILGYFGKPKID